MSGGRQKRRWPQRLAFRQGRRGGCAQGRLAKGLPPARTAPARSCPRPPKLPNAPPAARSYLRLHTTLGDLNIELHCDLAPKTCENFMALAEGRCADPTCSFPHLNCQINSINAIVSRPDLACISHGLSALVGQLCPPGPSSAPAPTSRRPMPPTPFPRSATTTIPCSTGP